jgi:hypothetical protein
MLTLPASEWPLVSSSGPSLVNRVSFLSRGIIGRFTSGGRGAGVHFLWKERWVGPILLARMLHLEVPVLLFPSVLLQTVDFATAASQNGVA